MLAAKLRSAILPGQRLCVKATPEWFVAIAVEVSTMPRLSEIAFALERLDRSNYCTAA
jgi:hypothetical protein